jgi:hypothetical protein
MTLVSPVCNPHFWFYDLPTRMSRRLLVTFLEDLAIGNVHLESLANHPVREAQLRECVQALKHFSDALLVGDFNFDSQQNWSPPHSPLENDALAEIMHGFVDVWPLLRTDRGLTFDSSICPYIRKHEQMRYDRVMARVVKWVAHSIERVGHEPLDVDLSSRTTAGPMRGLFLSDHFGLIATFSRKSASGVNFDSSEDFYSSEGNGFFDAVYRWVCTAQADCSGVCKIWESHAKEQE